MEKKFFECFLKKIDLSSFKIDKGTKYKKMFDEKIEKVKVKWDSAFKKISKMILIEN